MVKYDNLTKYESIITYTIISLDNEIRQRATKIICGVHSEVIDVKFFKLAIWRAITVVMWICSAQVAFTIKRIARVILAGVHSTITATTNTAQTHTKIIMKIKQIRKLNIIIFLPTVHL